MKFLVALMLAVTSAALAQQPQTGNQPLVDVNARITNGVGPGYWVTKTTGLVMNVSPGTAFCSGTIREFAGGTLTMTASTTNYVYLDTAASCAPAVKTAVFSSSDIPIAIVGTATSSVTTVDDVRTMFFAGGGGGGGGCTPTAGGGPYPTQYGQGEVLFVNPSGSGCDSSRNLTFTPGAGYVGTLMFTNNSNIDMRAAPPRDNDEYTLQQPDKFYMQSSTGNNGTPGIHLQIDDGDAAVGGGSGGGAPLWIEGAMVKDPTESWSMILLEGAIGGADKPGKTFDGILFEMAGGARPSDMHGIELQMTGNHALNEEHAIHIESANTTINSHYCDFMATDPGSPVVGIRAALGCDTDHHSTFGGPITAPQLNTVGLGASYISSTPIALTTCPTPVAGTLFLCADYSTQAFRISNSGAAYFTIGGGGGGSGNTTSTSLTSGIVPKANGTNSIINSSISDSGSLVTIANPLALSGSTNGEIDLTYTGSPAASPPANSVQITAASAIPTPYTIKMPAAQGTGAFTNDGSGNMSWSATGVGAEVNITGAVTVSGCTVSGGKCIASAPAANFNFTAIPGTYNTLRFLCVYNSTGIGGNLAAQFNGDTANNYIWQTIFSAGSTPSSAGPGATAAFTYAGPLVGSGTTHPSIMDFVIPFYSAATFEKGTFTTGTRWNSTSTTVTFNYAGQWNNTAAITAVKLFASDGTNLIAGSTCSVYGIL